MPSPQDRAAANAGAAGGVRARDGRACLAALEVLWPGARDVTQGDSGRLRVTGAPSGVRGWLLLRGHAGTLLLLPDSRVLAPAAVRGFTTVGAARRVRRWAGATLLAHGARHRLGTRLMLTQPSGASSIEDYLCSVLGRPVWVAVRLRPGRGPGPLVLQALDAQGDTVAFAKVGVSAGARELMRAEVRALETLGVVRPNHVVVPQLLHDGDWRGLDVVVQSPLLSGDRRPAERALVSTAMREISMASFTRIEPLAGSLYLRRLLSRLAKLRHDDENAMLHRALGTLVRHGADIPWRFGSWHGDWDIASTRADGGRIQVWGWERFDAAVPWGFDAAHDSLRSLLRVPSRRPHAVDVLLADAEQTLRPWGEAPGRARAVVTVYLVETAARRLHDEQEGIGADTPPLRTWLLPALGRETQRLLAAGQDRHRG
jgi:hypothetical protein